MLYSCKWSRWFECYYYNLTSTNKLRDMAYVKISSIKMLGKSKSFLHVWLVWNYLILLNSCFLRNEDIAPVKNLWACRPSHNFSIKTYRRHIFLFFDLRILKTCLNSGDLWILMKLGDSIGKNEKIWEILTKSVKFCRFFTKLKRDFPKTMPVRFFFKNETRKLKFGLVVPLFDF